MNENVQPGICNTRDVTFSNRLPCLVQTHSSPPLSFSTPVPDLIGDLIREGIQCLCLVPLTHYQHGHPERSACPEQREGTISSLRRSVFEGEILHFVQNDRFGVSLGIFIPMTEGTGPKTAEMTGEGIFVRVSETLLDWIRTS